MENLITLTVSGTHFYLIDCKGGKLLIDAGWTLPKFTAEMKANKVSFSSIKYILFTHHHPDHAGLVQPVKNLSGAKLIIHEKQIPFLENLRAFAEKKGGAEPITVAKDDLVNPSRTDLKAVGILGEIIETPGHSDDSISLALDNGSVFIGDLPSPEFSMPESFATVCASWQKLIDHGAQMAYHSHANPFPIEQIKRQLP